MNEGKHHQFSELGCETRSTPQKTSRNNLLERLACGRFNMSSFQAVSGTHFGPLAIIFIVIVPCSLETWKLKSLVRLDSQQFIASMFMTLPTSLGPCRPQPCDLPHSQVSSGTCSHWHGSPFGPADGRAARHPRRRPHRARGSDRVKRGAPARRRGARARVPHGFQRTRWVMKAKDFGQAKEIRPWDKLRMDIESI